jgi:uncharacterized tellurite resistance protein B-like protein
MLITKVLVADGIMTENERAFLSKSMDRLEISDDDRRRILDLEGWEDAEQALVSLSEDAKRSILSDLVDAASADGRLSPLETAMLKRITSALGLPPV